MFPSQCNYLNSEAGGTWKLPASMVWAVNSCGQGCMPPAKDGTSLLHLPGGWWLWHLGYTLNGFQHKEKQLERVLGTVSAHSQIATSGVFRLKQASVTCLSSYRFLEQQQWKQKYLPVVCSEFTQEANFTSSNYSNSLSDKTQGLISRVYLLLLLHLGIKDLEPGH